MAIVADEKKDQEQQQNPAPGPVTGGGPAQQQGGRVSAFSTGSQPSKGSGRFTNLQNYLQANQGAGEQLGAKIGSGLERQVGKVEKEGKTQAENIGNQVQAEKDRLAQGTNFQQQLQQDPTKITENADQTTQFSNLLNNQNIASNLATQAQTAQAQQNIGLQQAQQNIGQLSSEQGRFNLLKNSVKNPTYGTGQQRLDQLFMQAGNPQDLMEKQRALQKTATVTGRTLDEQFGGLQPGINEAAQQAEDVSKLLSGELGTQTTNLTKAQEKEAQELNTQNALRNNALQTFFTNGMESIQDPKQLEFIQNQLQSGNLMAGQGTYNVLKDPNSYTKYMQQGGVNYKSQDVLDAQELARYNALHQLSGGQGEKLFSAVGKGGVQTALNAQKLSQDIQNARQQFQSSLAGENVYKGRIDSMASVTGEANLADLLSKYEAGGLGKDLSNIDTNVYRNRSSLRSADAAKGFIEGQNKFYTPERALKQGDMNYYEQERQANTIQQQIRQDLYQDFLNRLESGGYNAGLGGVKGSPTPTNTFNVK